MHHSTRSSQKSLRLPHLVIISGKDPSISSGGYSQYARGLALAATSLGVSVDILCVGTYTRVKRFPYGTVWRIGVPYLGALAGIEMVALLPLSIILAIKLGSLVSRNSSTIVWGIGPWSLSAALLKIAAPSVRFFADYFTTIRHEFSGMQRGTRSLRYPITVSAKLFLASVFIIPFYSLLERVLLGQADKIITHYQSTQSILKSDFGLASSRFFHLPYSILLAARNSPRPRQLGKNLIITVTRHDPRKGIADLLLAYKKLAERRVAFRAVIIGDGMLLATHKRLLQTLDLTKKVILIAYVHDIVRYLERATLFVLPSHEEGGSSLAILEAMSFGVPVIATNVDGIGEDIKHNKSAILVPPADPSRLAYSIEALLNNPNKRATFGRNGLAAYRSLHGSAKTRAAILELLSRYRF